MNKTQMETLMTKIDECYPGKIKNIQKTTIAWYEYFKECDYECMLSVLNRYIRNNSFPPAISDLLVPYNDGIEVTEMQVEGQANRIRSALEWVENETTVEECLCDYYNLIDSRPIKERFVLARDIGDNIWKYTTCHEGINFNFKEWIEGFVND